MLSKINRLNKKAEINQVLKQGRAKFSHFLGLKFFRNQLNSFRFAIIISNKVSKKATVRNRLKRQISEILRLHLKQTTPGFDVILFTRSQTLELEFNQLKEVILNLFAKAKLIPK